MALYNYKSRNGRKKRLLLNPKKEELKSLSYNQAKEICSIVLNKGFQSGFQDIGAQNLGTMYFSNVFNSDDVFFYVNNLKLLGFIENTSGYIDEPKLYIDLIRDAYSFIDQAREQTGHEPIIEVSKFSITPLGRKTLEAFEVVTSKST